MEQTSWKWQVEYGSLLSTVSKKWHKGEWFSVFWSACTFNLHYLCFDVLKLIFSVLPQSHSTLMGPLAEGLSSLKVRNSINIHDTDMPYCIKPLYQKSVSQKLNQYIVWCDWVGRMTFISFCTFTFNRNALWKYIDYIFWPYFSDYVWGGVTDQLLSPSAYIFSYIIAWNCTLDDRNANLSDSFKTKYIIVL